MSVIDVHHEVTGPEGAPVVVLSNSLGATLEMWDPQVAALAERFRVVRYDTRGHGRSPAAQGDSTIDDLADDVLALLDRLRIGRAHVVGLSIGGMTGLRLAARNPERVDRLVVLCSSAHPGNPDAWRDRAATARSQGTGALAEAVVGRWFTPAFAEAHPDLVARMRETIAACDDEGYAGCCAAVGALDLRDQLDAITAPTLVISGADDPALPPEHQGAIAAGIRGAALLTLSPAAHIANVEQPEHVTAALLAHLGGIR
ncbi:3-oxoadipate enol-lactonase [Klenkia marina]|uniref:3-oxoadipate enol-lactonase n=1 Tax=Klenkia marina TaxID=1960309 RepID=A0A1G4XXD0_9ACTN|nr:3-oxoadipate enol-lactonase [Klenkia marina]SCX45825.1 3-oxoadipate enol-lactonase [Klenkia marina]